MPAPRLVAFGGALRRESHNQKLAALAAAIARENGAEVELVALRDFPMPVLDEDIEREQGIPEHARRFREVLLAHDGFLIATPEYNASIPGALKNAIDWATREAPGKGSGAAFTGKVAGVMSASPGALGGVRSAVIVRSLLTHLGTLVVPEQLAVSKAHEAFGPDGKLLDAGSTKRLTALVARVVDVTRRMRA